MKKVLIDSNVILDVLNKRKDHKSAARIFDMCDKRIIKGFICAHEVINLANALKKLKYTKAKRNFIITRLLDIFSTISANEKILSEALTSAISDYETALIAASAQSKDIDFIITRNIKAFKKGAVTCASATEALAILEK
jgi:predicted nucleic acid-binding protein